MRIGFTGTSKGMTPAQMSTLGRMLSEHRGSLERPASEIHHGDCVGADLEAHIIARIYGLIRVVHPPDNDKSRAFCGKNEPGTRVLKEKPYLIRNRDIVDATDFLVAAVRGAAEEVRSGTWSTVRYAEEKEKEVIIIWPNGKSETWRRNEEIINNN